MYQIGDQVVYGVHGVCRVANTQKQLVGKKLVTYLVLEPSGQEGSRYLVPTSNETVMSKLRPILSPAELEALLRSSEIRNDQWIQEENLRKQTYRELIASGDCFRLMSMVGMLYRHKAAQSAAGRKLHMCDENFLRDAERLLITEISAVLERTPEDVRQTLRQKLLECA